MTLSETDIGEAIDLCYRFNSAAAGLKETDDAVGVWKIREVNGLK